MSEEKTLKIVVDNAVLQAEEVFGKWGQVELLPGTEITKASVKDADALIVRSVTQVGKELVEGSKLRFVATATSGRDHIAWHELEEAGIHVADALGCNAEAVAQWVLSAFFTAHEKNPARWDGPIGIVGLGQVGRRLHRHLRRLGFETKLCDPFLKNRLAQIPHLSQLMSGGGEGLAGESYKSIADSFLTFEELRSQCKTITLHVPLSKESRYPTFHMVNDWTVEDPALINTSRGDVLSPKALDAAAHQQVILDVWPQEPEPADALLKAEGPLLFGSPHVAGYSFNAKQKATAAVAKAFTQFFKLNDPSEKNEEPEQNDLPSLQELTRPPRIYESDELRLQHHTELAKKLRSKVKIESDDTFVRTLSSKNAAEKREAFEHARKHYFLREELDPLDFEAPSTQQ